MSTFSDAQADLKKQFLGFLIATDFQTGALIYGGNFVEGYFKLHFIVTKIFSMVPENEIRPLYDVLERWRNNFQDCTHDKLIDAYANLSKILAEHFYSDIKLGLIQTGSLPGKDKKPENKPISPNQSSRI